MARSRKIRLVGGTIYARGSRAFAHVPLGWGRGRKRRTAPNTPEGIASLAAWVAAEVSAATTGARKLTAAEMADARAALEALPSGISLLEAARIASATMSVREKRTVGEAAAEYLAFCARSGRRLATIQTARQKIGRLRPWWGMQLADFTVAFAAEVVGMERAPSSQNNARAVLAAFFGWCGRMGYSARNPFAVLPVAKSDVKIPQIYSPQDVQKLFRAAESCPMFRRLIPMMAVGFFGGIRVSGILAMSSKAFDFGAGIFAVPPPADKKRRGYYAPIHPTLRAWLEAWPPTAGRIAPKGDVYKIFRALHVEAGVKRVANGMRHSFASYSVAAGGDAPAVALAMGHFGDTAVLFNHYRALATPSAAAAFFAVLPSRT